jgi:hypothetical protein
MSSSTSCAVEIQCDALACLHVRLSGARHRRKEQSVKKRLVTATRCDPPRQRTRTSDELKGSID